MQFEVCTIHSCCQTAHKETAQDTINATCSSECSDQSFSHEGPYAIVRCNNKVLEGWYEGGYHGEQVFQRCRQCAVTAQALSAYIATTASKHQLQT